MGDFSSRIDAALATEGRDEFMHAAADLDEGFAAAPFPERDDPLAMLGGLWALHLFVTMEGIWKFLAEPAGTAFHETLEWCERVGAERAVAYLREVAALYPGGEVPTDDEDRYALVEEMEHRGKPDPLRQLDRKHAGAMDELADRVRDWLRAHRTEVEQALEEASQHAPAEEPVTDLGADVEALLARLERAVHPPREGPEGKAS